jgi:hypothetical protein
MNETSELFTTMEDDQRVSLSTIPNITAIGHRVYCLFDSIFFYKMRRITIEKLNNKSKLFFNYLTSNKFYH